MSNTTAWQSFSAGTRQQAALESINRSLEPQATNPTRRTRVVKTNNPSIHTSITNSSVKAESASQVEIKGHRASSVAATTEAPFWDAQSDVEPLIQTTGLHAGKYPEKLGSYVPQHLRAKHGNPSGTPAGNGGSVSSAASTTGQAIDRTKPLNFLPPHLRDKQTPATGNPTSPNENALPSSFNGSMDSISSARKEAVPKVPSAPPHVPPPYSSNHSALLAAQWQNEARVQAVRLAQLDLNRPQQSRAHCPSPTLSVVTSATSDYSKASTEDGVPIQDPPMNSGTAAKSAAKDSPFPCTYVDCGEGFSDRHELKRHKYRAHDGYCKRCDVDTPNHQTLIEHKQFTERHIACEVCGEDFKSEGGRNRHRLKVSLETLFWSICF